MGKTNRASSSGTSSSLSKRMKAISSTSFVGNRINQLGKAEVAKTKKNPITKEKWLSKLRASIQKKVAVASYALFTDETSNDAELLLKEISALREATRAQCEALRARASGAGKKFEGLFEDAQDARYLGKRSNRFDARISRITDKFTQVASQVEATTADLKNRIANLKGTINSVEIGMSGVSAMHSNVINVAGSGVGSVVASSAMHSLNQHLSSHR
jgi:hypothetical protein